MSNASNQAKNSNKGKQYRVSPVVTRNYATVAAQHMRRNLFEEITELMAVLKREGIDVVEHIAKRMEGVKIYFPFHGTSVCTPSAICQIAPNVLKLESFHPTAIDEVHTRISDAEYDLHLSPATIDLLASCIPADWPVCEPIDVDPDMYVNHDKQSIHLTLPQLVAIDYMFLVTYATSGLGKVLPVTFDGNGFENAKPEAIYMARGMIQRLARRFPYGAKYWKLATRSREQRIADTVQSRESALSRFRRERKEKALESKKKQSTIIDDDGTLQAIIDSFPNNRIFLKAEHEFTFATMVDKGVIQLESIRSMREKLIEQRVWDGLAEQIYLFASKQESKAAANDSALAPSPVTISRDYEPTTVRELTQETARVDQRMADQLSAAMEAKRVAEIDEKNQTLGEGESKPRTTPAELAKIVLGGLTKGDK